MELKEQIKGELLKQKEEKQRLAKEQNSKLITVNLYTKKDNPLCENYKKAFDENGIKYIEKNIDDHKVILSTIQIGATPVIEVNGTYIVHTRDCQNPTQCINILRHFASPDFVKPDPQEYLLETIKNMNHNFYKQFQQIHRSLKPVISVITQIHKEIEAEKINEKENK